MFPLLKHLHEQVITESFKNKKKFDKSMKKEEGGDAKLVIFFTRPYNATNPGRNVGGALKK